MDLPKEYQNVMITYKGNVRVRDKYYDHYEEQIVTRRAFYSKSDGYYDNENNWIKTPNGYFNVPQKWAWHAWSNGTSSLMPHTFYHHAREYPENIIKWEFEKNES